LNKIEANGRTTEEAIQAAAQMLGVGTDGIEYEIVEEGTKGILGFGQTPTTVKAWLKEGYTAEARPEPAPEPVEEVDEEPVAEERVAQEEQEADEQPAEEPQVAAAPVAAAPVAAGDDAFIGAVMGALNTILKPMGVDAEPVLKHSDEDEVVIDIVGPDVAILIGRHGQTLDALQYLVGIIANRTAVSRRRVILDAERYRERHQETLERKAFEYAKAVKAEGKEAVLEPQSPRDRRIVHCALADDPDVYTYSEGEGDDRHVVISPKK